MDVISHGLWGGIAFGRKNRKSYWLAFFIGVAPDLFSFGVLFLARLLGFYGNIHWGGAPDADMIPGFVSHLYNISHSLIVFVIVFLLFRIFFKRWILEMLAWPFHIAVDIFSHSYQFYPTPFLWPISDYKVDAVSWGDPRIFFPNVALLAILYAAWFIAKKIKNKN